MKSTFVVNMRKKGSCGLSGNTRSAVSESLDEGRRSSISASKEAGRDCRSPCVVLIGRFQKGSPKSVLYLKVLKVWVTLAKPATNWTHFVDVIRNEYLFDAEKNG